MAGHELDHRAIRQQQGQSLNADARIYDVLVGFAATHHSWAGVKATTERLSHSTGRPMLLTTLAHRPIVRTGHWRPLALQASATIDALHVDPVLDPRATGDGIDPRARGPFGGHAGVTARRRALAGLIHGTAACLSARHLNDTVTFGLTAAGQPTLARAASDPAARTCFAVARRRQLSRYVAPAAMLFVGGTVGPTARVHLSGAHRLRIILVASAILLLTVVACGLAARRLTGPLRRLTAAAQRLSGGERAIRVPEAGSDELGRLITASNAMAARRDELEQARSDMVSDVAHELRTPVSNIRGWLEAAHDGIAEPDHALLASLLEEAIVLHRIIDDLRDLSAADAGELVLHCEPVELAGLLEQTAAAHRDAAQAAEVSIVLDVEQGLGCEVDPVRVRQAIGNLVANACAKRYCIAIGC